MNEWISRCDRGRHGPLRVHDTLREIGSPKGTWRKESSRTQYVHIIYSTVSTVTKLPPPSLYLSLSEWWAVIIRWWVSRQGMLSACMERTFERTRRLSEREWVGGSVFLLMLQVVVSCFLTFIIPTTHQLDTRLNKQFQIIVFPK